MAIIKLFAPRSANRRVVPTFRDCSAIVLWTLISAEENDSKSGSYGEKNVPVAAGNAQNVVATLRKKYPTFLESPPRTAEVGPIVPLHNSSWEQVSRSQPSGIGWETAGSAHEAEGAARATVFRHAGRTLPTWMLSA